jgi:hypothetical protein
MNHKPASWFQLWLLFATWAVLSGWLLSAFGWLGGWGYLASLAVCLAGVMITIRRGTFALPSVRRIRIARRRWRRLPPLLYLLVFLMALLGAVLYAPSNYDALSYRLPRMLHWLAEGRWHWIHTNYHPVNTRASATEWMQIPFLLLGRSDRLLVLPNLISFALLPGLIFSILRSLRISRRVAWNWMWIFPSGYCYALQAGGIGNDLPGAVLFLSGIHFALRARKSRAWSDFAWACIGMALATGAKTSNVPLGLPWLVAIAPALPLLWKFLPRNLLLAPVLVLLTFLPNAWLNHKYCGDWTGLKAEPVLMRGGDPLLYVSWNIPYLVVQNLTPPVFPGSNIYNREVRKFIPENLKAKLRENFEPAACNLYASEIMMEENGPIGVGITLLLVLSLIGAWWLGRKTTLPSTPSARSPLIWLLSLSTLAALLVMFVKSGLAGSGRYLAPHYLLLILPFISPRAMARFLRTQIWKIAITCSFAALMLTMVISPARPLWPAFTVLQAFKADDSSNPALKRVWDVYTFYRQRPDVFVPLVAQLPAGVDRIGLFSANTPESSLWKPFGSRRVVHILGTDSVDSIRQRGVEFIAAGPRSMSDDPLFPSLEEWCRLHHATIIAEAQAQILVRYGIETWYIIKLPPVHEGELKTES